MYYSLVLMDNTLLYIVNNNKISILNANSMKYQKQPSSVLIYRILSEDTMSNSSIYVFT